MGMRVRLTRDSVAIDDDGRAPHAREVALRDAAVVRDLVGWIVDGDYLASTTGGATWALRVRSGKLGATTVAVLTVSPSSLTYVSDPFALLGSDCRAHLCYLAQQDAARTVTRARADPSRTDLRVP